MNFASRHWLGAKKATSSFRPEVEILEDRLVPSGLSMLLNHEAAVGPHFDPVAVQLPTGGNAQPILTYNGGTLLSDVEVQGVYFNDPATQMLQGQLDGFLTTLATSKWTTEMLHGFSAGNYNIGAGSFLGDDNTGLVVPEQSMLDDSQIQQMLSGQLAAHQIAQANGNTLYFVFAPAGVEVTVDGYNSASDFLGYHNSFVDPATGETLYYAVIPYQGAAPDGATGPDGPNANLGAEVQEFVGGNPALTELQNITGVSSHEFSEAVTDPGVGNNGDLGWLVTDPSSPAHGQEIGDLANAELATYHGYVVQEEWGRNASDPVGQATGPEVVPSDTDFYISQVNNPTAGNWSGIFATFTDYDGASEPTSDFTVGIYWGDGAMSRTDDPATHGDISIVNNGDGTFAIVGQHDYTDPAGTTYGTYPFNFDGAQIFVCSGDEISWNKPPITLQLGTGNSGNPQTFGLVGAFSGTPGANNWYTSDGVMTLSGIPTGTTLTYSLDGGPSQLYTAPFAINTEGMHIVVATETYANGIQFTQSFDVNIDSIPPTLATNFGGTQGNNGWFTSDVTATLTSADATSGLACFYYSLDNGPMTAYTTPFTINGDGTHTLTTIVIDFASNYLIENDTINIDTTPPSVFGAFSAPQGSNGWYTSSGLETLSAADGSGIAAISYRLDSGPVKAYTGPFLVSGDGTHNIVATATDVAGNVTTRTFTVGIEAAPTGLTPSGAVIAANGYDRPTFTWTAATGADHYYLAVVDDNTGEMPIVVPNINGTSYVAPSTQALTPGHTYTWQVGAYSANGTALGTSTGVTFTLATLPTPVQTGPVGPIAASNGYDTPTFTWNAAAGADHYYLLVVDNSTGQVVVNNSNVNGTTLTLNAAQALTPGHSFTWYVIAVSTNGRAGSYTVGGQAFTLAALPTPAQTGPSGVLAAASGYDTPTYSWISVPGASHYFVLVVDTTANQVPAYNPNATGTSWTPNTPLMPGHRYTWYLGAYSTNGVYATWTAGQSFFLALATPTLTGPSGAVAASAGYDTPTYSWNSVAGADHYYLFVVDKTTGKVPVLNSRIIGTSWRPSTPLTPGDQFTWYLGAYTADGQNSTWTSQAFSLAALAAPMPDAVPSGNPPIFTWSSVAGADHYCLLVIDQTTGQIAAIDLKITGASWTPSTPLTRGHNYIWYIGAYSADGLAAAWSVGPAFQIA